jgi:hypothetical protein
MLQHGSARCDLHSTADQASSCTTPSVSHSGAIPYSRVPYAAGIPDASWFPNAGISFASVPDASAANSSAANPSRTVAHAASYTLARSSDTSTADTAHLSHTSLPHASPPHASLPHASLAHASLSHARFPNSLPSRSHAATAAYTAAAHPILPYSATPSHSRQCWHIQWFERQCKDGCVSWRSGGFCRSWRCAFHAHTRWRGRRWRVVSELDWQ